MNDTTFSPLSPRSFDERIERKMFQREKRRRRRNEILLFICLSDAKERERSRERERETSLCLPCSSLPEPMDIHRRINSRRINKTRVGFFSDQSTTSMPRFSHQPSQVFMELLQIMLNRIDLSSSSSSLLNSKANRHDRAACARTWADKASEGERESRGTESSEMFVQDERKKFE